METDNLCITNCRVLISGDLQQVDVVLQNGCFAGIGPAKSHDCASVIDGAGKLMLPGIIDPHTHMGIPIKNTTSADDFRSGSISAAFGGITTILDFTVQQPGVSIRKALEKRMDMARNKTVVDVGFHVNITDQPDKWLKDIPELIHAGYNSFKVFSTYREAGMMISWEQFRSVLQVINNAGGLLMLHAEDNDIIEAETARQRQAGRADAIAHALSRPAEAEAAAITRASEIAGELGARLYIVHVSSRAGLDAGRRAKDKGVKLYLETCPQYLLLNENAYTQKNGHYYIATPPLRTRDDCSALWEGLADGSIDTIGTDHCPFTRAQKDSWNGDVANCPNGLPGVETSFPLLYAYGVQQGKLSLSRLITLMSSQPATIFGLDSRKGDIRVGLDADFFLYEPGAAFPLNASSLHGNADWSPYEGLSLMGKVTHTYVRGKACIKNGSLCMPISQGQLLRSDVSEL